MSTTTKILATFITLVALVALGAAGYLTWKSWSDGVVAGCMADGAFDCDDVLASRWSKWFGVPVAALGGLAYLGIVATVWPAAGRPRGAAMSILLALASTVVATALWFVGLQLFQLQSFCLYCMIVHGCGLTVAGLVLAMYLTADPLAKPAARRAVVGMSESHIPSFVASRPTDEPSVSPVVAMVCAAIGVVVLIGGQVLGPDSSTTALSEIELKSVANRPVNTASDEEQTPDFMENKSTTQALDDAEPAEPERLLSFVGLAQPVDTYAVPMVGDPEAEHVVVELLDYTCTHCRKLHPRLLRARERYGDQLGIVLYHAPLSSGCNDHMPPGRKGRPSACEYAHLAISVWMLAPEHFSEFHNWLMEGRLPPPLGKAKQRAMELAGDKVLLDQRLKSDITERLRLHCANWHELDSGLPILLFGDSAVQGGGKTDDELFATLEQRLGIEPLATASE